VVVKATEAVTLTLPAAASSTGVWYDICLSSVAAVDVYAVTLDANASELINAATTNNATDAWFDQIKILCDGVRWLIMGKINN
jgi:hypothetical protein